MTRCPNHWRGQHTFEPRYDAKMPEGMESVRATSSAHIEAVKNKTYVRDICTRCGESIERQKP